MDRVTVRQVGVGREAEAGGRDGDSGSRTWRWATLRPADLPNPPPPPRLGLADRGCLLLFLRWGSSQTEISNAARDSPTTEG